MICQECGCQYEDPAKELGLTTSIDPGDRFCYECYCEITGAFKPKAEEKRPTLTIVKEPDEEG